MKRVSWLLLVMSLGWLNMASKCGGESTSQEGQSTESTPAAQEAAPAATETPATQETAPAATETPAAPTEGQPAGEGSTNP